MTNHFHVAETFVSIQGESTWAGCPCFFIRLAGCNLRCVYCDTAYALEGGELRTLEDLVREAVGSGLPVLEVTGGEPLLQQGTPALLRALLPLGTVLLETNGSLDIACVPEGVRIILDIKTPASGQGETMRWENLAGLRPGDEIKFVLCSRSDYEWARTLLRERNLAGGGRTVLFGAAWGRLPHADLAAWILEDRLPVRLNPVLHRWIWPDSCRGR
jgi:7-carboxy-7-deazaguanine synthase